MSLLLFFAFLSGLVTIAAPCIWPILPIILSVSSTGGHRKPLGITLGIMVSFGLLTLSISYIVKLIPFDPNVLRYVAVVVIGFLGLTLLVPALAGKLESVVSKLSSRFSRAGTPTTGFASGFVTGLSLGVIWTPCAGPILATIATLAATQAVNLDVILVTFFYVLGVGIPLFIFATLGKHVFSKTRTFSKYTGRIQQVFGIIMILTAALIATNYDKVLQIKLLNAFPQFGATLNSFESNSAIKQQLDKLKGGKNLAIPVTNDLFNTNVEAPEFTGINKWLNPEKEIKLSDLRGQVVLVDFWTYTCINCIRTLPHVTSWYDKYHDQGFTIIGVHTPEFEFEKTTQNVFKAITQYNIHYPVAQDNDYATWNAYSNQYWPAEYLIDSRGMIRRAHFGEGEYDTMEMAIRTLLKEAGKDVKTDMTKNIDTTPQMQLSPETYLGSERMQYEVPDGKTANGSQNFPLEKNIPLNTFSFEGNWNITDKAAIAGKGAALEYKFIAGKVFLVMRPGAEGPKNVTVFIDGVKSNTIVVDTDKLYQLVDLATPGTHLLRLEFSEGIEAYAFTFGQ